jgi:hypothetical protein
MDDGVLAAPPPPIRRRPRRSLATGAMILGIMTLAIPFATTGATPRPADRLTASTVRQAVSTDPFVVPGRKLAEVSAQTPAESSLTDSTPVPPSTPTATLMAVPPQASAPRLAIKSTRAPALASVSGFRRTFARRIITVPSSIDSTGASDASAKLQKWLESVADGSTIRFRAGGTYRMDAGLRVFHQRHDLTFDGRGATLRSNGDSTNASSLFIVSGTNIKIRNFNLVGNSPTPGRYRSGKEYAYGVQTYGAHNVEIANVTIRAVYGDGLMVGGWSDTVWFHDSRVVSAGRNGVAILAGRNITVERVAFDKSGWATFDIEPWETSGGADNVKFLNNTAGTWNGQWGFFFGACGVVGSVVNNVTVSGNTITGSPLTTYVTIDRRQNIVFTNNVSSVAAAGPVLDFAHIDGLTITGNIQPLTSGVLARIVDSTGVTYP